MEKGYGQADAKLATYVADTFADEALAALYDDVRARQTAAGMPDIQVGLLDGLHLEVIARALQPRVAVEIGTLGGFSGVCIARGLAPGGVLHTFEVNPRHADIARATFDKAGLSDRVVVHVGPAAERLVDIEAHAPVDLVFVDADKQNYPAYLGWASRHLRVGGVVLGDNAFLWGRVTEAGVDDSDPEATSIHAMRSFNRALAIGGRFRATMLPTAEGLVMGVRLR